MRELVLVLTVLSGTLILGGCGEWKNPPLLFGQSQSVGITISGSTTDQGAELTLGYRDRNFAIIPVTVRHGSGDSTQIIADAGAGFQDALSVIGQFEVNAKAQTPEVSLGKFFATGIAAQKLADGFAAKLGYKGPGP